MDGHSGTTPHQIVDDGYAAGMTLHFPAAPTPAAPPRAFRIGDPLVVLGALLVFGFSFAPFVRYSDQAEQAFIVAVLGLRSWFSAWSLEIFMAPLTSFVVLAGLLAAAGVVVRLLLRRDVELVGFRLRQVEVGLSLFMFTVLLGMVASDKHALVGARGLAAADPSFDAADVAMVTGWGAILMLVGAAVTALGAVLNHLAVGPVIRLGAVPAPAPPAAEHWQPPAGPGGSYPRPEPWQPPPPQAPYPPPDQPPPHDPPPRSDQPPTP